MATTVEAVELVSVTGQFRSASNLTLLAEDADGTRWVYKPVEGINPLWDFPAETLPIREVLAYEVSLALGVDLVPETVLTEGPFGPGSAQRFLDQDLEFDFRPLFTPTLSEQLWPVAVLDLVCNNADRKLGHMIWEHGTARMWAIDNGLSFHAEPKLRTVLWGFAGRRLPADLIVALGRVDRALDEGLRSRVSDLLTPLEATALTIRVAQLVNDPVHLLPPDDRPAVPWPVW